MFERFLHYKKEALESGNLWDTFNLSQISCVSTLSIAKAKWLPVGVFPAYRKHWECKYNTKLNYFLFYCLVQCRNNVNNCMYTYSILQY